MRLARTIRAVVIFAGIIVVAGVFLRSVITEHSARVKSSRRLPAMPSAAKS